MTFLKKGGKKDPVTEDILSLVGEHSIYTQEESNYFPKHTRGINLNLIKLII